MSKWFEQIRFKLNPKNRKPTVGRAIFPLEARPASLAPARPRPHTGTATHASGPPRTRESPEKRERAHTGNGHTSAHTRGRSPSITGARACRSDAAGALKCRVVFEHVHRGDRLQERGADLGRGGRLPQRVTRVGDRVGLGGTSQHTPTRATIYTRASRQTLFLSLIHI